MSCRSENVGGKWKILNLGNNTGDSRSNIEQKEIGRIISSTADFSPSHQLKMQAKQVKGDEGSYFVFSQTTA